MFLSAPRCLRRRPRSPLEDGGAAAQKKNKKNKKRRKKQMAAKGAQGHEDRFLVMATTAALQVALTIMTAMASLFRRLWPATFVMVTAAAAVTM
eukprot:41900-Pyramimonas_sp.AAC.1